jgi:hypothetical protein
MNGVKKLVFKFFLTTHSITSKGLFKLSPFKDLNKTQAYPFFIKIPNSFFLLREKKFVSQFHLAELRKIKIDYWNRSLYSKTIR